MLFSLLSFVSCFEEKTNPLTIDHDGDGYTEFDGDCDDDNPRAYPGAAELDSADLCMVDNDEDGYGSDNIGALADGAHSGRDCDDSDPDTIYDMDCDDVLSADDCDDNDSSKPNNDRDCDGVLSVDDCDDEDVGFGSQSEDLDCDGVLSVDDCDDDDSSKPNNDRDCDGVLSVDDCDDEDVGFGSQSEDLDCDGVLSVDDCDDNDPLVLWGQTTDLECDNFYLSSNGVTVLCSDVGVNDSGYVDGVLYTKRDRSYLDSLSQISSEWSNICTSDITDMSELFYEASNFNQNIGSWDVGSVTDMSRMFYRAWDFNQNIGRWDVGSVTDMSGMFYNTNVFNKDIGSWDVSSVTDMSQMFYNAGDFNQDLSDWCVSNISAEPYSFDYAASYWNLPRPVWGTCP